MTKKIFFTAILAVIVCIGCGNDSCTTIHSYGVSSFTKDIGKTCFKKLAEDHCYQGEAVFPEVVEKAVADLQKYLFIFHKNCTNKSGTPVECPDFIPETLKMTKFAGCETYTIDPHTDCDAECPKIFFETDSSYFKIISETGLNFYINGKPTRTNKVFTSDSTDGKIHFYSEAKMEYGVYSAYTSFSWYEENEAGTESENRIFVETDFIDPDAPKEEPVPDTDIVPDEDEEIEVIDG